MHPPKFWYFSKPTLTAFLLRPLAWLLYRCGKIRFWGKKPYIGKTPIICVGNITVGGNGKTPTCLYIADILMQMGYRPVFLTRGYGGSLKTATLITDQHTWQETGDEAQLLAFKAPVIVARDRVAGAELADSLGYDVIIMDDGLQNHPCFSARQSNRLPILVLDTERLFGNKHLIPAGALREPIHTALAKVKLIMAIGKTPLSDKVSLPENLPIFHATKEPLMGGHDLTGQKVIAFAGLGNNQQFFKMLVSAGAEIVKTYDFPDHYVYSDAILKRMIKEAESQDAVLITTEKDMIRIPKAYYPYLRPFLIRLHMLTTEKTSSTDFEKILQDFMTSSCPLEN